MKLTRQLIVIGRASKGSETLTATMIAVAATQSELGATYGRAVRAVCFRRLTSSPVLYQTTQHDSGIASRSPQAVTT